MHWYGRPRDAFRAYIDAHVSMLNAPACWLRIAECSREDLLRRLVRACAMLDSLENQAACGMPATSSCTPPRRSTPAPA
jgi:hypothetical protein